MTREAIWAAIELERHRQAAKWDREHDWGYGDCSSDGVPVTVKMAVLTEECGEVSRAVLDRKPDSLRDELVQVAAVAVAWLESMS
jgi:NTP pyrophosphatase (non-canonical NTP hydrolase)